MSILSTASCADDWKINALKEMQNYEECFVKIAAKTIYADMENVGNKRNMVQIKVAEEMEELQLNEATNNDWNTAKSNTAAA